MFQKSNWKEPIYKSDLRKVLLYGLLTAILVGILGGELDYALYLVNFNISIGLILLAIAVGIMIRRAYFNYHILYPVLSIPFLLVGLLFLHFTYYSFIFGDVLFTISQPYVYLWYVEMPVLNLINGIKEPNTLYIIYGIFDIVIFAFSFWYCYRLSKGRS